MLPFLPGRSRRMTTRRQPMTPLRQRMWEDLQLRNYSRVSAFGNGEGFPIQWPHLLLPAVFCTHGELSMGMRAPVSFQEHFATLTDPRCPQAPNSRHRLMDILILAV